MREVGAAARVVSVELLGTSSRSPFPAGTIVEIGSSVLPEHESETFGAPG